MAAKSAKSKMAKAWAPRKVAPKVKSKAPRVKNQAHELVRRVGELHKELDGLMLRNEALDQELQVARADAHPPTLFSDGPLPLEVPLPGYFNDFRGSIKRLTDKSVGSVQVIYSNAGTRRASHWHRNDSHLCFVVKGRILYLERPVGSTSPPTETVFTEGYQFFTGPNMEHEMLFPEETIFVVLANQHRTPEEYEKDLVRLEKPLEAQRAAEAPVPVA
mgnify:CR=1 FL=1